MDVRICCFSCLAAIWLSPFAVAQPPGRTFQKCFDYASQIEQLNDAFVRQQTAVEKVVGTIRELQPRIEQSEQKIKQLMDQRMQAGFQREKFDALSLGLIAQVNSKTGYGASLSQLDAANALAQLGAQADWTFHQMKTLDQASRISMQQRLNLFQQLTTLLEEYRQYHSDQLDLFSKYWELADVAGERSDCELQAGRRALDRSVINNPGAIFMQAMLAMRANKLVDADAWLEELRSYDEIQYVILAARADLQARQGKPDEALQSLKSAVSKSKTDLRIRRHRAVVLTRLARYRDAESEWEFVLKQGGHDIPARCAIAMLNALDNKPSDKQKLKALENAQVASRLAGEDNWLCSVAVALAQAANDHPDEARTAAELALTQAIGSQRSRCQQLHDRLKSGVKPLWLIAP